MRANAPVERDGGLAIDVDGPGGATSISVRLVDGDGAIDLAPARGGAASLAATLLPAMRNGEDLVVDGPVGARLLGGAATVQSVLTTWDRALRLRDPWYRRVAVQAPDDAAPTRPTDGRGTAAFFTGGVDSFHTVATHRDHLAALIYVHGFDVALDDHALRSEVSARLQAAATDLGLPLLEVETDLQAFGDRTGVGWPDYHGAALATIALLLAPRFSRVLVPATHTYAHLEGLGSHPLLDPSWSTEDVEIVHDGADATRVDKVRTIAELPAARDHLRVCWENRGGAYNCGRCEKCVRTGVAIRIAGVEGRFRSVPPPSLRTVAAARPTGRGSAWTDLHDELVRIDANPRLRRAVQLARVRHELARAARSRRWPT